MIRIRRSLSVIRFHAEDKGHYIVAFGYLVPAIVFHGHNPVITGMSYGLAALLTTHHVVQAKTRKGTESE